MVGIVLLIISLSNVFVYNKIVGLQHLLKNGEKNNQELRLVNIDLKDQLYKLLDTNNLGQLAKERGLVKVQKPQYLEINSTNDTISFRNFNN